MSKHHHHKRCPKQNEEILDRIVRGCSDAERYDEFIFDKLARRCCRDGIPDRVLPADISPEDIRRMRCFFDCLCRCVCGPRPFFEGVEALEDSNRRR
jgi:hypothetical protein